MASKHFELNIKRRKFALEYAKHGNGTKAAMIAYKTPVTSAATQASRLLRNDKVLNAIETALPDDLLHKVHLEGLKAKSYHSVGIGKGHTKLVAKPDYHARDKYLDKAYKIKRRYADITLNQALIVNIGGVTATKYKLETAPEALQSSKTRADSKDDTSIK